MKTDEEDIFTAALSLIDGFEPHDVALALPSLDFAPDVEAHLILSWTEDFAVQVFKLWKPGEKTWTEVMRGANDKRRAIALMVQSLPAADARRVISLVGQESGGSKMAELMKTFMIERGRIQSLKEAPLGSTAAPITKACTTPKGVPTTSIAPTPVLLKVATHDEATDDHRLVPQAKPTPHPTHPTPPPPAKPHPAPPSPVKPPPGLPRHRSSPTMSHKRQVPTPGISDLEVSDSPAANTGSSRSRDQTGEVRRAHNSRDSGGGDHQGQTSSTLKRRPPTPGPSPFREVNSDRLGDAQVSPSRRRRRGSKPKQDERLSPQLGACNLPRPTDGATLSEGEDGDSDEVELRRGTASPSESSESDPDEAEYSKADVSDSDEDERMSTGLGSSDDEMSGTGEEDMHAADDDAEEGEEGFSDGYVDPTARNPWEWSQKKNDEKVALWDVESSIKRDPRSMAPVRTKWMYRARKKEMSDDEYGELMEKEHRAFMSIPVACRTAVGQMWYKDSRLDWEVRVFLAPFIFSYAKLKIKGEEAAADGDHMAVKQNEAERKTLVDEVMTKLMDRFPDCSPKHKKRKIAERYGAKELRKYLSGFRNKFTSDAGRMKRLYLKNVGKVGILAANTSASSIFELLGRKRVYIAFHLWGGSESGGKADCDAEIDRQMDEWMEAHPEETPQDATRHRIKIVQDVRFSFFDSLPTKVQKIWKKRAKTIHMPSTPEEEQCFVDAALVHLVDLLKVLSERGNIHFVLLASGRGSYNVPIVAQEFRRKGEEGEVFLSTLAGLGSRVRSDYIKYAAARYGGNGDEVVLTVPEDPIEDAILVADPTEEDNFALEPAKEDKPPKFNRIQTFIAPFQPDLTETKTVPKMVKAIAEFIMGGIGKLHGRVSWDRITKEADVYVEPGRMPMDPDNPAQRLQLQKPNAMSNARVKEFFKFLIASYDGTLQEPERFRFKLETRHLNIPAPVAPPDPTIHYAAANAAKTKLPKGKKADRNFEKKKAKARVKRKLAAGPVARDRELDDFEGSLWNDDFADDGRPYLQEAVNVPAASKSKPAEKPGKGKALRIESPPESPSTSVDTTRIKPTRAAVSEPPQATLAKRGKSPPRPKARPKGVLDPGTDELRHPSFLPGDQLLAHLWIKTKENLEQWGRRITHSEEQSRSMPFRGLSGERPDFVLPGGLYSAFSIIQLWGAYQAATSPGMQPAVRLDPRLGLNTVDPAHHISKLVSLLIDPDRPLPTARYVYTQSQISPASAGALFIHVELVLSRFIDSIVASEQSVLEQELALLQGMRLAVFMGATGFIRDDGETGPNTFRTSALQDRFVKVLAAVAFSRYFKVVLGHVLSLYCETSSSPQTKAIWIEMAHLWEVGCLTLARALVRRRSDLFSVKYLSSKLPLKFKVILQPAFDARPWWTPGALGAPESIKITNKQAIVSTALSTFIKDLNWTAMSFIERGQVLLLVFVAAIQVETGRVKAGSEIEDGLSAARMLTQCLLELRSIVQDSEELDLPDERLSIPTDSLSTAIRSWEIECQGPSAFGGQSSTHGLHPPGVRDAALGVGDNTRAQPVGTEALPSEAAIASQVVSTSGELMQTDHLDAPVATPPRSTERISAGAPSALTTESRLSPEPEDPTLPSSVRLTFPSSVHLNPRPTGSAISPGVKPPAVQPSLVPAVRKLEEVDLPRPKKPRITKPPPAQQAAPTAPHRVLRSSTVAADPIPTPANPIPTPAKSSRNTRSATSAKKAAGTAKGASRTTAPGRARAGKPNRR
ncbi:hypothetical protein M407DRAFT_26530 [Tulasnella calospora MUT 4182]|uniref:Uncharacterized protein n=1 Tax=Tulasnella calospora MUT 4182 TaxID=1051891 RepID=A0A0C3KRM2_9AGAM|nr:hypothetical protein M407DRAFT_26530 [Tulasnella calospora MUT 4182]